MTRFTIFGLLSFLLFGLFFSLPCSGNEWKEVSIVFNPDVQFEYSDQGVRPNFYHEGNGIFSPFKAKGRMSGRVFKGRGSGTIEKGKVSYTCNVELTLDRSSSRIDNFVIAVDTVEYLKNKRQDFTSKKYRISGRTIPLAHVSHHKDHDTLSYALKGPLAKKQISGLKVEVTTKTRKQIAKNQWAPVTYWRKSVDYKLGRDQGVFILLKGRVAQTLGFDDSPVDLFDIEKESEVGVARPTLDFNLTMVDKKKIDSAPSALKLTFDVTAVIDSPYYGKDKHRAQVAVYPLIKPNRYQWNSDMALDFKVPLYEILSTVYKRVEVHDHLTEKQFRPLDPKEIPEITTLTLDLKLLSAQYRASTDKKTRAIDLPSESSYEKQYTLGAEVDLAKVTKLKVGKAHSIDWHDISGLTITAIKFFTQADKVEMALTATDIIIQAHGGYLSASEGNYFGTAESAGSVVTAGLGAIRIKENSNKHLPVVKKVSQKIGLVFMLPQIYRLTYKEFYGVPAVVRKVEAGLKMLGYSPIDEGRATEGFPIWVNPKQQRLAMIDPAGLVHPVKRPDNFHLSWAFFRLQETAPLGKSLLFKMYTGDKWTPWWTLGGPLVKHHKILPPAKTHCPLRMKLPTPAGYEKEKRRRGFGSVQSVTFEHSEGSRITLDRGEDYDGIVDFGWEDRNNPFIFEKPYITLVSGRLRVKDEASRIGIGFYRRKDGVHWRYQPRLWCEPVGTEYAIDFNPATGRCNVEVVEGQVIIRDAENRIVDRVETGRTKMFSVPMQEHLDEILEKEQLTPETAHTDRPVQPQKPVLSETRKPSVKPVDASDPLANYLGILLPRTADRLIVVNTLPGSPARKAGLKSGDRLLTMDGRDLSDLSRQSFIALVRSADPDARHTFRVKRKKRALTLPVTIRAVSRKTIEAARARHEKEADRLYEKAQKLKKEGHYRRAESLYAKALDLNPAHRLSYDYRAYCLDKTGKRHQAYPLLEMSLLMEDEMYNNYLYGKFLSFDSQYRQAIDYLEKAADKVNTKGNFYYPFMELGGAWFMLDNHRASSEALLQSERMGDTSALTIGTLGVCFDKLGRERKAISYYRRYLAMNSSNQRMNDMARSRLSVLKRSVKKQKHR